MAANTNPHNFSSSLLSSSYHDTSLTLFSHYQLENSAPAQALNHLYSDAPRGSLIFKLEDLEHSQLALQISARYSEECDHIERRKKKRRRDDFVLHPPNPLNFPYHNDSLFLPTAEPPSIDHFSQSSGANGATSGRLNLATFNNTYPGKSLKRKFSYSPISGKTMITSGLSARGLTYDKTMYEKPDTYNQNEYEIPQRKPNLVSKMWRIFGRQQRLPKKRGGWFFIS